MPSAVAFAQGYRQDDRFGLANSTDFMFSQYLQRLSVGVFSALRHGLDQCGKWMRRHPRLANWIYGVDSVDTRYREFNGWYFAQFSEQEKMLADQPRMDFYHAAIARHIRPGDRVIDLGTGTGILAAFAARQGAAKVYPSTTLTF